MLQQTQVPRVIEKYQEFLKAFPTVHTLAQAPLVDVLHVWSGMGYNRRAKFLREAASILVGEYGGRVPRDAPALRAIPGIGPYTASAVRVFAFNLPDTMIETNIRAAFIHHFFADTDGVNYSSKLPNWVKRSSSEDVRIRKGIKDSDLLPLITTAAEGQDPREWHWALMDYGSHIKKLHGNPARQSAHYAKQSKFEGSLRQVRGAILRALSQGTPLLKVRRLSPEKFDEALAGLARDGLIIKRRGKWGIA